MNAIEASYLPPPSRRISWALLLAATIALGPRPGLRAQSYVYEQLYAFSADTNGYSPKGALVQGADGYFYGTCEDGGQPTTTHPAGGYGTVFKITPDGILTTLAWFHGTTGLNNGEGLTNYGQYPFGSMIQATDGNFYGTSEFGVFRVTPGGVLTAWGSGEAGDPIEGTNGHVYAADDYYDFVSWRSLGGSTASYAYPSGTPSGGLIQASDGNFYGLTSNGGAYGFGTAYKLTPEGVLTTLVSFGGGGNNSRWPYDKMLQASDGNLYGVCDSPEQVFKLTLSGTLTTFAEFGTNGDWGYNPNGGLIEANDGNFYGTTYEGGGVAGAGGTVFKITPGGRISTLFIFTGRGAYPGSWPVNGVTQASDGNLYGTCPYGGDYGAGNIFRIIMPGPLLTLNHQPSTINQVVLSWRTNYTGFKLESSTAPSSASWIDCTNSPTAIGERFFVTNSISPGAQFFRLKK